MTTIFVINAISSLLAGGGILGWFVHKRDRARREIAVQPLYLTTRRTRRPPLR